MRTPLFHFIQSSIWMRSLFTLGKGLFIHVTQQALKPLQGFTSGTQDNPPRQDYLVLNPSHC